MRSPLKRDFGNEKSERVPFDFYETPKIATELLSHTFNLNRGVIWEPACGKGAISEVLINHGCIVKSSDLNNYGYGDPGVDFLKIENLPKGVQTVITNPPYEHHLEFCKHSVDLINKSPLDAQAFMLLRLDFLSSQTRRGFLTSSPLYKVLVFSRRIGFMTPNSEKPRKGVNYAWYWWMKDYRKPPTIGWL